MTENGLIEKKKEKTINDLIEDEYLTHNIDEDDEMYWLKEALKEALNTVERKIYLTYLERGTYAATAKAFKVTMPTLSKYVNNLKTKIIDYVDKHMREPADD